MEKEGLLNKLAGDKHLRTIIDLSIIVLIAVIVFRNFIFSQEWPAGGDILGFISREYLYGKDFKWLFVWRPNSFGYVEGINLIDFFFMLLRFLSGTAANTAKVFAFSSFILAGFSMYAFGHHYSKSNVAALAGSLTYILNQAYLTQLTEAHLDLMFSYALAPAVFLFLDKALDTAKSKYIITSAALFAVMLTSFHPQATIIYGSFVVLFCIIRLIQSLKPKSSFQSVKRYLRSIVSIVSIGALLSAFVWLPLLLNVRALYLSTGFTRGTFEDTYVYGYETLQDAFVLTGKESWGYKAIVDVTTEVSLQILPVSTILLSVFTIAYVITLIFKRDRYSIFFGLSALISILISMGPYSPFDYSFSWAWFNIPYFQTFRAISRWAIMTAFANSFFVCASVGIATEYLKRYHREQLEDCTNVKIEVCDSLEPRKLKVSLAGFQSISKFGKEFLYYSAALFLIAVLVSGFISTWFLFNSGLQVSSPPQDYTEPLEYLARVPGEYKIVTVGRSEESWLSTSQADFDFLGFIMLNRIGWGHDLGYESTFIHNRPVLQDGGLSGPSLDFVDYLRFDLAKNNVTQDLLRMLGAFDYKYMVIPTYVAQNVRDFFLVQDGGNMIYNENGSIILENKFHTPRIYAPEEFALVFGSAECLSSVYDLDSFDLSETALVPVDHANYSQFAADLLDDCSAMVLVDVDEQDLILRPSSGVYFIYAGNFGVSSLNATGYWVKDYSHAYSGTTVFSGKVLTTYGPNTVSAPFNADSDGTYEIFTRIGFAPNRGNLLVSVDGLPLAEIRPFSDYGAQLRWVRLGSIHLQAGTHLVTLRNDGSGYNDVDVIAFAEQSQLNKLREETINFFQDFGGCIVHLFEAEKAFSQQMPGQWSLEKYSGEGYALCIEGGSNISPAGNASTSSVSDNLEAKYAIDEDLYTRWASAKGMPQYVQIEWSTPQDVRGVAISFENAYAQDYQIQTWNGNKWVDQVIIKDNLLLNRSHHFPASIMTDKMRILVTSAPAHNMVSIYEIETFSPTNVSSSKVFLPKKGRYNIAARLTPNTEPNATLFLKIDEELFSICGNSDQNKFGWHLLGSASLDPGEHEIGIAASGRVTLDKIAIYRAENETQSVSDLFGVSSSAASVSYEKTNPCKYVAHVSCTKPFLLVFSEAYHPMWRAYIGDQETSPIFTNFLVNGFYINKTGNFDVTIYFSGQKYADVGLIISGSTAGFIVAVAIIRLLPTEAMKRWLNEHLRILERNTRRQP